MVHITFTDFFHTDFIFLSQSSVQKQPYNVLQMGETQMLLLPQMLLLRCYIIKLLYKFSRKIQHCITFIFLHNNQPVFDPGNELLKLY